jgi:hypothetical protein
MEAAALDKLIEKGEATPRLAQAIGEALDITLKAANLVTVPMLDARFAQLEAKLEARFGALEKSLESTKVWAVLLYAGLAIALFGTLTVEQIRTEQLITEERARTDKLIAEDRIRTDRSLAQDSARIEESNAELRASAAQAEARMNAKLDQLRSLLVSRLRKP